MDKSSPSAASLQVPVKPDDGLRLSGFVTAVETLNREYDGKQYMQLKATLTNGKRSYFFVADDKKAALPQVDPFSRGVVEVDYANVDKGNITVRGTFRHE